MGAAKRDPRGVFGRPRAHACLIKVKYPPEIIIGMLITGRRLIKLDAHPSPAASPCIYIYIYTCIYTCPEHLPNSSIPMLLWQSSS